MNTTQYDYDHFITFFSAIPDDRWCVHIRDDGSGRHCALGHLDERYYSGFLGDHKELTDLLLHFKRSIHDGMHPGFIVADINNGDDPRYQQPTPKARILAALADAKARAEAALEQYESRPLKPLSPVLQEQVSATDATQLGLCASVVLEEA